MAALTPLSATHARKIHGGGTPESAWQAWPPLWTLPCVNLQDLVPRDARAVIVAPHPDDEVLGTGGLIAELARCHRDVLLIAVTDGTASHPRSTTWPPDRLALERPLETQRALACLGAAGQPVMRLGFQDGTLQHHEPQLIQALSPHVSARDVLITTWRQDGHPDHEACGRACASVVARTRARLVEVPIWTWHWASPADARVPWARACQLPLTDGVAQAKRQAVRAFKSQTEPDASSLEGCVLPPAALERLLRPMEVFFR